MNEIETERKTLRWKGMEALRARERCSGAELAQPLHPLLNARLGWDGAEAESCWRCAQQDMDMDERPILQVAGVLPTAPPVRELSCVSVLLTPYRRSLLSRQDLWPHVLGFSEAQNVAGVCAMTTRLIRYLTPFPRDTFHV